MHGISEKRDETSPPVIAVIGGGFTGTAVALHLARETPPTTRIKIFEPRAVLGAGLAYSTQHPAHRINAPAQRMSLWADEPDDFHRWLFASDACRDDPQAALPDGRIFPQRGVFGSYVAAQVHPYLVSGKITHVRSAAQALSWQKGRWAIEVAGPCFFADAVVLATGHAPPCEIPGILAPVVTHQRFIADPWQAGRLAKIGLQDRVLIVGTGLTMADVVAALDHAGHTGPIHAISRRGQVPRQHAEQICPPYGEFTEPPGRTARLLLRQVREAVARAAADGIPWQSVFDALRGQAGDIWTALPEQERRRFLRHARPYWETHRHRLPPPTCAVMERRRARGTLTIEAAAIEAVAVRGQTLEVTLKPPGRDTIQPSFDTVILTTGPGPIATVPNWLVTNLLADGIVKLDDVGQGFVCDEKAQPLGPVQSWPPLFVAGPLARGSLGDVSSVPEIVLQAENIAHAITREIGAGQIQERSARGRL